MNLNLGGMNFGSGAGGGNVAKRGCGGGCGAVFGVILGILLVPLGLYLTYYGELRLVNHGKVFDGIEMVAPDAASGDDGELVKISGAAEGTFIRPKEWDGAALFIRWTTDEYQEEEDSDGEVSHEWNNVGTDKQWADFSVGPIQVRPQGANPVGEQKVYSAYKKKYETAFHEGTSQNNPQVGDQRMTVEVLDASKPVIVVGLISNGTIQGGGETGTFVVSTLNAAGTSQALHTQYKVTYWVLKGGAVLCIFVGILLIFGPLTWLVGYVPFVGQSLSCAFAAIAFVVALVAVGAITVFIKAFWLMIVLAVVLIVFVVIRGVTTPRGGPGSGAAVPPVGSTPAQPVTPATPAEVPAPPSAVAPQELAPNAKFCAQCGKELDAGSQFCRECGAKVGE